VSSPALEHALFVYGGDEELAARIGPFLREGLEEGSEAIMVVDARKGELLRDALDSAAARVEFIDCAEHYTRPEAALAGYDATLRRLVRDGASSVRVFAEFPALDSEAEYDRWIAYEAIVNRAFAHHPAWITCGYDTRVVPEAVVEHAGCTHPRLLAEGLLDSPSYLPPSEVVSALTPEPAPPLAGLEPLDFDGDVRALRRRLAARMARADVTRPDVEAMLQAAGEVLANAQSHGGGIRELRVGEYDERFVLEISDGGPGLDDPAIGYLPPTVAGVDGAGMWVARQLTRRLELVPCADGLTVRLWI
jgi:anti-sigma regulatory factor (Ser/Thr protein kinase)